MNTTAPAQPTNRQSEIGNRKSPPLPLDPRTYDRALACVHCGLCLPACPTYTETLHEADSPRGRIQLMRALAEGAIEPTPSVRNHLDLCLDCRACETACPSGVVYHELIEETRARMYGDQHGTPRLGAQREGEAPSEPRGHPAQDPTDHPESPGPAARFKPSLQHRFLRLLFLHLFTRPTRLKLALLPARLMQKVGLYALIRKTGLFKLLPAGLRKMEQMLPPTGPLWPRALPEHTAPAPMGQTFLSARTNPSDQRETSRPASPPAEAGSPKASGVFFPGCVGSVMFAEVNRKAVDLLAAAGCEVIVPRTLACCGAIHHHNGAWESARAMARKNIDAVPSDVDFITNTIAGCGAMLHDYDHLLRDDPAYADRAHRFAKKVRDVSQLLIDLGLPPTPHPIHETVTYHDACHLAHAQKTTAAPRALLAAIPGLTLVPLPEADMCCGAAGTYNLTQPAMATALADRKLAHIASTGAPLCATGNVGCAMHLQSQAAANNRPVQIVHPVELLHRAVFGE